MNAIQISESGIRAATVQQLAAASNLANMETPGYRRFQSVQRALSAGGVEVSLREERVSGENVVEDMVGMMGAVYALKANVLSVRVADHMVGTALRLLA